MRGAYYVATALLVVASSQIAAKYGHQLQAYDHDVMAAGDAVVKALPNRIRRGSRDVHDNLAHEERSFISILASMIKEAVVEMPPAEAAAKETPRIAAAAKEMPRAAEAGSLTVKKAVEEALDQHWKAPYDTAAIGDPHDNISSQKVLYLAKWNNDFRGMKPMVVMDEHKRLIEPVHKAFDRLCGKYLHPTTQETSYLWNLMKWNVDIFKIKQALERHAKRFALMDLQRIQLHVSLLWIKWEKFSQSQRVNLLNLLMNLHFQRWVRMYNIFNRYRPDINHASLNLELSRSGNTGKRKALALHEQLKMLSSYLSNPFKAASTSIRDHSAVTQSPKRTLDGNTGLIGLSPQQSKTPSSTSLMPHFKELMTSGDHSISTKRPRFSYGGLSTAFTPYESGDHSVLTQKSRLSFGGPSSAFAPYKSSDHPVPTVKSSPSFGGPSSAFVPYKAEDHFIPTEMSRPNFGGPSSAVIPQKHLNAHNSKSVAPASTALTLKDDDTKLSLGGIYSKNSDEAPSVH